MFTLNRPKTTDTLNGRRRYRNLLNEILSNIAKDFKGEI